METATTTSATTTSATTTSATTTATPSSQWKEIFSENTDVPIQKAQFNSSGTCFAVMRNVRGLPKQITVYRFLNGEYQSSVIDGEWEDFELAKGSNTLIAISSGKNKRTTRNIQVFSFSEEAKIAVQKGQTFTVPYAGTYQQYFVSIDGLGHTIAIGRIASNVSRYIDVYFFSKSDGLWIKLGNRISAIADQPLQFAFLPHLNFGGTVLYAGCNVNNGTNYGVYFCKFLLFGSDWKQHGPSFVPQWDNTPDAKNEPWMQSNARGDRALLVNGRYNYVFELQLVESKMDWVIVGDGKPKISTGNFDNSALVGRDSLVLMNNVIFDADQDVAVDDTLRSNMKYLDICETREHDRFIFALSPSGGTFSILFKQSQASTIQWGPRFIF